MHLYGHASRRTNLSLAAASLVVIRAIEKHGKDADAIMAEFEAEAARRGEPTFKNTCWAVAMTLLT